MVGKALLVSGAASLAALATAWGLGWSEWAGVAAFSCVIGAGFLWLTGAMRQANNAVALQQAVDKERRDWQGKLRQAEREQAEAVQRTECAQTEALQRAVAKERSEWQGRLQRAERGQREAEIECRRLRVNVKTQAGELATLRQSETLNAQYECERLRLEMAVQAGQAAEENRRLCDAIQAETDGRRLAENECMRLWREVVAMRATPPRPCAEPATPRPAPRPVNLHELFGIPQPPPTSRPPTIEGKSLIERVTGISERRPAASSSRGYGWWQSITKVPEPTKPAVLSLSINNPAKIILLKSGDSFDLSIQAADHK